MSWKVTSHSLVEETLASEGIGLSERGWLEVVANPIQMFHCAELSNHTFPAHTTVFFRI